MRSFVFSIASAVAFVLVACGGSSTTTSSPASPDASTPPPSPSGDASTPPVETEPTCGGDTTTVTPTGNTYDDTGPGGTTPIRFDMFVYAADAADGGADGGVPDPTVQGCPSDGLVAKTRDPITLANGTYLLCREAGSCGCMRAELVGGQASFVWLAGPGGGVLELHGCARAVK